MYSKVPTPEVVMDICSFDISRKSHKVIFLPTHHPNERRRVVRRMDELQEEEMDSRDIYYSDTWDRYLQRPAGELFDFLTYEDFYRYFHTVENPVRANIRRGPFDRELEDNIVYATDGGAHGRIRYYKRYRGEHFAITRHRPMPLTESNEAAMHLLMLGMPTRTDCDDWLETFGAQSFLELATWILPPATLDAVVPNEQAAFDREDDMALNAEQENVVRSLIDFYGPQCSFVHGRAGTGKSTVLKALRNRLAQGGLFEQIVLAPTGVAAVNVGGRTIHSFFGAKTFKGSARFEPNLFDCDWNIHRIRAQGKRPYIIIDEASMLSSRMLETISETLAKIAHGTVMQQRAFGGIRICLFADLGQLGPIGSGDDFTDWIWNAPSFSVFRFQHLRTPCRQGEDEFFGFLSIVRNGPQSAQDIEYVHRILKERDFRKNRGMDYFSEENSVTCLVALQEQVDAINQCITSWHGDELVHFAAKDNVQRQSGLRREDLEDSTGLLAKLTIWIGAKVMVMSNISLARGLVNGAIGRVTGYNLSERKIWIDLEGREGDPQVVLPESRESKRSGYARNQLPLRLAYALTIHKAQGLTLPRVAFELSGIFCSGQAYVAMSRVRRLEDLFTASVPTNIKKIFPEEKIKQKLLQFESQMED